MQLYGLIGPDLDACEERGGTAVSHLDRLECSTALSRGDGWDVEAVGSDVSDA